MKAKIAIVLLTVITLCCGCVANKQTETTTELVSTKQTTENASAFELPIMTFGAENGQAASETTMASSQNSTTQETDTTIRASAAVTTTKTATTTTTSGTTAENVTTTTKNAATTMKNAATTTKAPTEHKTTTEKHTGNAGNVQPTKQTEMPTMPSFAGGAFETPEIPI